MDLPFGELMEKNLLLKQSNIREKIVSLLEKQFSGYLVLTVEGISGFEEGAILVHQNNVIGAVFDYLRFDKKLFGEEALPHFFNACRAERGIFDIIALSKQQIELIIAFNEKIELRTRLSSKEMAKAIPEKFNPALAEKFLGSQLFRKESKLDVFKKIGLAEFSRKI
ncbi:MAG TPA: DUF2226 domain-containing protein [archaeon]|nr:DUF2226 domain-containing protein [archaeon]